MRLSAADYYLTPAGELTQAEGRWLASPDTMERLGIQRKAVEGHDFIALMEGRHPGTGRWLRREGAGGGRGGGIDVTLSAPKSVSVVWALGNEAQRRDVEAAHAAAVSQAVEHLRETVPVVRSRYGAGVVEEPAHDVVAAEYLHTTARGVVDGDVPDPQLHSHVVLTSAVREDGRFVAVASRPIFRSAREVGAFYRSALAAELADRGYGIERGTRNQGRYFEIAGVPKELLEALARSREVARAAERFRAKWGRAPEHGELRWMALENRKARWSPATCNARGTRRPPRSGSTPTSSRPCGQPVEHTSRARSRIVSRVPDREGGDVHDQRAAGGSAGAVRRGLAPDQALERVRVMVGERRVFHSRAGS